MNDVQHIVQSATDELNTNPIYHESYKKQIGKIYIQILTGYGLHGDHEKLATLYSKGKHYRKVRPNHASIGASSYALQYHCREGYTLEVSMIKGCLLWNQMNDCKFFTCKVSTICGTKLVYDCLEDDTPEIAILQKMCRLHHKKAKLEDIRDFTYVSGTKKNPKTRHVTFWMCFDEAIKRIPSDSEISVKTVSDSLRVWNYEKGCKLFTL